MELSNIHYKYSKDSNLALENISFTVRSGEWISVVGPSNAGKSTMCGILCGVLQSWPGGKLSGHYKLAGQEMTFRSAIDFAGKVGVVFQDPQTSIVQDIVEDEIAFGPENMCVSPAEIESRIKQVLSDVDLTHCRKWSTHMLSGGQMQRVNIAAMLAMMPQIIILDDAAASLDDVAARRLLQTLIHLHRKGHTIITLSSRYNVEEPSDRVLVLHQGSIIADVEKGKLGQRHKKLFSDLGILPNAIKEERLVADIKLLDKPLSSKKDQTISYTSTDTRSPLLQITGLNYAYSSERMSARRQVLNNLSLTVNRGDFIAVTGPNGSGKTTLGKLIVGLLKPADPTTISFDGQPYSKWKSDELVCKIGYVFQIPEHQFVADTVLEEAVYNLHMKNRQHHHKRKQLQLMKQRLHIAETWLKQFGLYERRDRSPYQLGAAEKRLLTLVSILITEPDLIVLDEPTSGLDYASTEKLMTYCVEYAAKGKAVVMITHDQQIASRYVNRTLKLEIKSK